MKLSTSILILASSVLATPTPRSHSERSEGRRMQRRAGRAGTAGRPMSSSNTTNSKSKYMSTTDSTSDVVYSTNWAGAVYSDPPSGESFNAVSASFIVPTVSVPSDVASTDGEYGVAIWVGIDGYTYSTAILQTGVDIVVSTNGDVTYDAWYEWYPDVSESFDNLQISAGDNVTTSVTATSSTTGVATIENLTTGQTATIDLSSTYALEGENAEWIVEDYSENDELIAFADFGNMTFVNCVASTSSSSEGLTDAIIMDLDNSSGEIFTSVDLVSSSSLLVTYNISGTTADDDGSGGDGMGMWSSEKDSTSTTSSSGEKLEFPSATGLLLGAGLWAVLYSMM